MSKPARTPLAWLRNSYLYPFYAVNAGIRRGVEAAARECSGGVLLDIGCGLRPYERLFGVERCFGFDLPHTPRPREQKRPDVWFDGSRIPVRDNAAEHVLCSAVLQYCYNPDAYMRELARILKAEGNLILVVPQSEALMEAPFDRYRFTLAGMEGLCEVHGLRILKATAAVGFWQTMAFHVNCMAVRSLLKRNRAAAALVCSPLGLLTQSVAAVLDRFTAYDEDANSWIVHARKSVVGRGGTLPPAAH
jgi:SAM-dependent methyltransferase